jgi:hypothetical protein
MLVFLLMSRSERDAGSASPVNGFELTESSLDLVVDRALLGVLSESPNLTDIAQPAEDRTCR